MSKKLMVLFGILVMAVGIAANLSAAPRVYYYVAPLMGHP